MITEGDDRFVLELRASRIAAVVHRPELSRIDVIFSDGAEVHVSGDAQLTKGSIRAPGIRPLPLATLSEIQDTKVASAVVFKAGRVRLVFDTGHHLNVLLAPSARAIHVLRSAGADWHYSTEPRDGLREGPS